MDIPIKRHNIACLSIIVLSLFAGSPCAYAWHGGGGGGYHGGGGGGYYHGGGGYYHGGGGGGYYHGGNYYHGGYYGSGWGWGATGVVVGVPLWGLYAPRCSVVQQCYPNGNCVQSRVCN